MGLASNRTTRATFAFIPNALLHLRASERVRSFGGVGPCPRSHFIPMGEPHLTPSKGVAYGTRLHGGECCTRLQTVSTACREWDAETDVDSARARTVTAAATGRALHRKCRECDLDLV